MGAEEPYSLAFSFSMASLLAILLPQQHENDKSLSRSNPQTNCSCGEMEERRRRSGYLVEIQEAASECRARELRGTATLDTGCGAGEAEQPTRRPPRPQHRRRRRRRRSTRVRRSRETDRAESWN